jgi:hypothetical protein
METFALRAISFIVEMSMLPYDDAQPLSPLFMTLTVFLSRKNILWSSPKILWKKEHALTGIRRMSGEGA